MMIHQIKTEYFTGNSPCPISPYSVSCRRDWAPVFGKLSAVTPAKSGDAARWRSGSSRACWPPDRR